VVQEEEEEVALLEEVVGELSSNNSMYEHNVAHLLLEAEGELTDIQAIAKGEGAVPPSVPAEGPPDVDQVIGSATLDNIVCFCEQEVALNTAEAHMSIQVWWRIAKRGCQIHGMFELLRVEKSKLKTLPERYALLVKDHVAVLSFRQAGKYDRLGKFLAQFPLFVYQRKWTTLSDWFQEVTKVAVLIDCIRSIASLSSIFLKDRFILHVDGFEIIPGLMVDCINDNLIATCKTCCEQDGDVIFNNTKKPESRHNDKKRIQLSSNKIEGLVPFKEALIQRLTPLFPLHQVDSMVALLSKSGCKAQLAHTDYSPKMLVNTTDNKVPLACLVALTDGTLFDVWPGAIRFDSSRLYKPMQIRLRKGDVLIFRGDLVHGGAAAGEKENIRIHAYLDVEGVKRPKHGDGVEETHFMSDEKCIGKR
jgi:hypothetical protein